VRAPSGPSSTLFPEPPRPSPRPCCFYTLSSLEKPHFPSKGGCRCPARVLFDYSPTFCRSPSFKPPQTCSLFCRTDHRTPPTLSARSPDKPSGPSPIPSTTPTPPPPFQRTHFEQLTVFFLVQFYLRTIPPLSWHYFLPPPFSFTPLPFT